MKMPWKLASNQDWQTGSLILLQPTEFSPSQEALADANAAHFAQHVALQLQQTLMHLARLCPMALKDIAGIFGDAAVDPWWLARS